VKLIETLEEATMDSPQYYELIILLVATLAHEYSHWLRTQILPDDATPPAVAYAHARGDAPEGEGESGFVAEIAIFGGVTQCNTTSTGSYTNFRIVDRFNVAHHLPLDLIEKYWRRGRFEPFVLNNPILPVTVPTSGDDSGGVRAESPIPPSPCDPNVVIAEMQHPAPSELDVENFANRLDQLDEEQASLDIKMVITHLTAFLSL
jgi:hypothetical protein